MAGLVPAIHVLLHFSVAERQLHRPMPALLAALEIPAHDENNSDCHRDSNKRPDQREDDKPVHPLFRRMAALLAAITPTIEKHRRTRRQAEDQERPHKHKCFDSHHSRRLPSIAQPKICMPSPPAPQAKAATNKLGAETGTSEKP